VAVLGVGGVNDEQRHIEEHRYLLYVAEQKARTAYAREAPDEMVPLAEAVGDGAPAELLRHLHDQMEAAIDARKAFEREHPRERHDPHPSPAKEDAPA
jgi:hypothetical protein